MMIYYKNKKQRFIFRCFLGNKLEIHLAYLIICLEVGGLHDHIQNSTFFV